MTEATKDDQLPESEQPVEQVPVEEVEDLTITTREDLPPIPQGFPAPFKLWHHG